MPVKSLMELATTACLKNIRDITTVGDFLPYETVRHILFRIDNATQLRQLELNSPQIEGETGEIWLKIIEREFPMEYRAKAYKPQNPKNWHKVWEKYKKDHDTALEKSEKQLMDAFAGLKQAKQNNTSKIVDRRLLPSAGRVAPKRHWSQQRDPHGSALNFTQGSRTKTHTGASVMRKVRREVKEIKSIHGALSRPAQASNAISRLRKAPSAMVNDNRRATQPKFRATSRLAEPSAAITAYEERATYLDESEEDTRNELFDSNDDDDDGGYLPVRRSPPRKTSSAAATSLLKKKPATVTKPIKRSGILSNSYKGPRTQPTTTTTTSSTSKPSTTPGKPSQSTGPAKPAHRLPQTQTSPPPQASSPGPSTSPPPPVAATFRKRKAVDIFLKPRKKI